MGIQTDPEPVQPKWWERLFGEQKSRPPPPHLRRICFGPPPMSEYPRIHKKPKPRPPPPPIAPMPPPVLRNNNWFGIAPKNTPVRPHPPQMQRQMAMKMGPPISPQRNINYPQQQPSPPHPSQMQQSSPRQMQPNYYDPRQQQQQQQPEIEVINPYSGKGKWTSFRVLFICICVLIVIGICIGVIYFMSNAKDSSSPSAAPTAANSPTPTPTVQACNGKDLGLDGSESLWQDVAKTKEYKFTISGDESSEWTLEQTEPAEDDSIYIYKGNFNIEGLLAPYWKENPGEISQIPPEDAALIPGIKEIPDEGEYCIGSITNLNEANIVIPFHKEAENAIEQIWFLSLTAEDTKELPTIILKASEESGKRRRFLESEAASSAYLISSILLIAITISLQTVYTYFR